MKPRIATLTLVLAALWPAAEAAAKWSKTLAASDRSKIDVSLRSGSIKVIAWAKAEVKVETSESNGPEVQVDGDEIQVRPAVGGPGMHPFDGDVEVSVPAQARVSVRTLSGSVHARGLAARASLRSISGHLTIESCSGPLSLRTVSGSLRLNGAAAGFSFKTVSGSVEAEGVGGEEVSAKSVSGRIRMKNVSSKKLRLKSHSGGVILDWKMPADGNLSAKSFSGDLEIALPAGASFAVSAKAKGGEVEVGFPIAGGKKSESEAEGTVGKGGAVLNLKTFSGRIRVKPAS
jgi:DUF4097 and DUF4098 domain-containing protein YvlB